MEADQFAWLLPLRGASLLPAGLALLWGLGVALAQLLWSDDWRRIFALAAGLGGAEWLRGHLFTGFPWNAIGYALTSGEILMQSAALFGLYALNVIAVAIFAAPAALAPADGERRRNLVLPSLARPRRRRARALRRAPPVAGDERLRARRHASASCSRRWSSWRNGTRRQKDEVLSTYFRLSAPEGDPLKPGTILVWPELAFPIR